MNTGQDEKNQKPALRDNQSLIFDKGADLRYTRMCVRTCVCVQVCVCVCVSCLCLMSNIYSFPQVQSLLRTRGSFDKFLK